ncbi:50S ribosomal protein L28 [Candidatus Uhrbacteria bacterium]|nr:50S ribosomal protein L28 [Candidatus Uhrbacteria bacterium]
MSKVCVVTKKTPLVGNSVSHSNVKVKRRQMPNLQKRVIVNPATGKKERVLISTRGLKTLMKWAKEGKAVDLGALK